jgi:hypothetical protein
MKTLAAAGAALIGLAFGATTVHADAPSGFTVQAGPHNFYDGQMWNCVPVRPNDTTLVTCSEWDSATGDFDRNAFTACVDTQPDCVLHPAWGESDGQPVTSVKEITYADGHPNPNPGSVNPDGTIILRQGGPQ